MDRFKASSGLFHYLIANDDVYYTDAMIRLNLQDYLYYELKNEHYDYVFSVTGSNNKYNLNFYDAVSYFWAIDQIKGFFERRSEKYQGEPVEVTGDKVRKLLKKARKSAFVFRLHTFCEIYNGLYAEVGKLMNENADSGNIVILQMDTSAESSLPDLMDEKSILRRKFESKFLFPEIVGSFNADHLKRGAAYINLEMKTGDRCTCYNSFTIGAIRRVINYVIWFKQKKEADYTSEDLEKIVKFIYAWYRSTDMKLKYPDCLSDNPGYSYKILSKDIEKRWHTIIDYAAEWNEEYSEDISQEIHVTEHTDVTTGLRRIKFRTEYKRDPDYETHKREWMYLCREYSKPHGKAISENAADLLTYIVGVMDYAVRKWDSETLKLCMDCLRNVDKKKFEEDEKALKIWKAYRNVIEISRDHFELEEIVESENASIKQWNKELNDMILLIEMMERRHTVKPERDFQKNKAINLRSRINNHQDYINQCISRIQTFSKIKNSLEIMIASDTQYNVQQFQEIIDNSSNYIEQFTEDSRQMKQNMERIEYSLDDLNTSSSGKDIDSDYQTMLELMEATKDAFNESTESELPDTLDDMVFL